MLRLTFLGTSSGAPTIYRNTSAIAVESIVSIQNKKNHWMLVDCGEGTQQQLLKSHLSLNNLSVILISHCHGDHCYGLGGLLSTLNLRGRKNPLTIIAPRAMIKLLDVLSLVSELTFDFAISFLVIEEYLYQPITIELSKNVKITVHLHKLSHRIDSYGFEFIQSLKKSTVLTDKLMQNHIDQTHWHKILQQDNVIQLDNQLIDPNVYKTTQIQTLKVVIAGDNDTPNLLTSAVKGCHLLVHEATYTHDVWQAILSRESLKIDPKHSSAKLVAQFAQAHKIANLILTHFSARYQYFDNPKSKHLNMGHIRLEAQEYYKGNLILAKDFLQVLVSQEGVVLQDKGKKYS